MNSLVVFAFQDQAVRIHQSSDGNVWFCLTDILRLMHTSTTTAQSQSILEETFGLGYKTVIPIRDTLGRDQETLFVSEPATTFLISRSRTEAGKKLNRWMHCEVLPAIRKTGKYELTRKQLEQQMQPERSLKELEQYLELSGKTFGEGYKQRLFPIVVKKYFPDLPILDPQPEEKASVSSGEKLLTPTQLASELGFLYKTGNPNPQLVNKLLQDLGYQTKVADGWSATNKAIDAKLCDRKPVDTNSRSQKDQLLWSKKVLLILSEHKPS